MQNRETNEIVGKGQLKKDLSDLNLMLIEEQQDIISSRIKLLNRLIFINALNIIIFYLYLFIF